MKGIGCDNCKHLGYRGRMGIFEIFQIDDEVRHMINEKASTIELRKRAREMGMRTLREDGIRKVLSGLTSADRVIDNPPDSLRAGDRVRVASAQGAAGGGGHAVR